MDYDRLDVYFLDGGWEYNEEGEPIDEIPPSAAIELYVEDWGLSPQIAGKHLADALFDQEIDATPWR